MRKFAAVLVAVVVPFVLAACGSSSNKTTSSPAAAGSTSSSSTAAGSTSATTSTPAASGPKISSATVPGLGPVLVDAKGRTLYMFVPDKDKKVTCVGGCAAVWPPAFVPAGQKPVAEGAVKQSLLGSDPDPAGGHVITYAGWPLYTYVSDTAPGKATGQALNLNGGLWYVLSPAGAVIKKKS